LVDTQGKLLKGPYAALSYRWGEKSSHLMLTPTTLAQLTNGMKLSDLPKTFDHAITAILRLGISSLWIDSLCILQSGPGHEEEWQESYQIHGLNLPQLHYQCLSSRRTKCFWRMFLH
jgi:hypothetical protein